MKKLTEDELKRFNEVRVKFFDAKAELADVVLRLERLKNRKETLLMDLDVHEDNLAVVQNEMFEKYGEVKINFSTGEIHS